MQPYPQQYAQPAQPQYPPQFPQQPAQAYPQQYAPPAPQQYPPQYAPQGYPQQAYAPPPPLPTGTLDSFYEQPSGGGGPSWKFNNKPVGTSYAGIVARPVTDADVRAQTDNAGRSVTYKDGRAKFVMVVPMQIQPSQEYPDGVAGWWVKGQARDELARAMAEAGAPVGPPEAGAGIRVTKVGERQVPNMTPQILYRVEYMRPNGAAPVAPPATQPVQYAQPAPVLPPAPVYLPGGPIEQYNNPAAPKAPAPQYAPQPAQAAAPSPVPAQAPQPAMAAAPAGFNQEQAALFAKLTGGQTPG
jgi:hypothetical protein